MSYELPFVLYDNVYESGTVTVTSEAGGFPKENIYDWLDWTYWKATSSAINYINVDKGAAGIEVDTVAMLGHNLGSDSDSSGGIIRIEEDDNPSFTSPTTLGLQSITSDDPFYIDLTSGTERYNRVGFLNMDSAAYVAVLFLGKKMEIPVGPEFSFDPDRQNIMGEYYKNYNGNMITSNVKYADRDMNVEFKRISQSFIASDILPFYEDHYGEMKPFFFIPDPGDVFGTGKMYYLVAPDNPSINLSVYNDDISFRNWTMVARGVRQSKYRS